MRILKIKKEHEGKIIYGLGTGNNMSNTPVEFDVVKVNRKYVKMNSGPYPPNNYHPETGATQEAINSGYSSHSGYKFFESLADIERYNDNRNKIRDIRSYFESSCRTGLSYSEIDIIHAIIKGR